ncbi:MAG: hypothetical protein K2P78_04500 [Gemmataceae bacterium]|nr:hypothetical protein [Gemmataceae bacterium]
MKFLAIVRYSHGGKIIHEFICPLERATFVRQQKQDDPKCRIKVKNLKDIDDDPPADEAHWYTPHQPAAGEGGHAE